MHSITLHIQSYTDYSNILSLGNDMVLLGHKVLKVTPFVFTYCLIYGLIKSNCYLIQTHWSWCWWNGLFIGRGSLTSWNVSHVKQDTSRQKKHKKPKKPKNKTIIIRGDEKKKLFPSICLSLVFKIIQSKLALWLIS